MDYPAFTKTQDGQLYAYLNKTRTFHLSYNGFSRGAGFEFRIYQSPGAVRRHAGHGDAITFAQFKVELQTVFARYILEIERLLPLALLEAPDQKGISSPNKKSIK